MAELLHLGFMFYFIHKIDTMASNNSGSLRSQAAFSKGYGYEVVFSRASVISFPEKSPSGPMRIVMSWPG